jgi:hypothetical protein
LEKEETKVNKETKELKAYLVRMVKMANPVLMDKMDYRVDQV